MQEKCSENKYYTPTIEEFHVGFEYYFASAYPQGVDLDEVVIDGEEGYKKYVYDIPSNSEWDSKRYITLGIERDQYKVKYLDKEDIESLGFVHITNRSPSTVTDGYFRHKDNQLEIEVRGNLVYIKKFTIGRDKSNKGFYFTTDLFRGNIKNKSELIKLLDQLDIEWTKK